MNKIELAVTKSFQKDIMNSFPHEEHLNPLVDECHNTKRKIETNIITIEMKKPYCSSTKNPLKIIITRVSNK